MSKKNSMQSSSAYRVQEGPSFTRRVSFDALLPETQRLLAACSETPGRSCLASVHQEPFPRAVHWYWVAILAGLGAAMVLASGYSELSFTDVAQRDRKNVVVGVLLGLSVLGVGLAYRARRIAAGTVFRPGLYLLPRELVDARSRELQLFSTEALTSVSSSAGHMVLYFQGGWRFRFPSERVILEDLQGALERARNEAEQAGDSEDKSELSRLDPFHLERVRWGKEPPSIPWSRRLGALRFALPLALCTPFFACVAGRFWGIERAVRESNVQDLLWFSVSDRWLADWADRRWRSVALSSSRADDLVWYLELSTHRASFPREVANHLDLCDQEPNPGCVRVLRTLCKSGGPEDRMHRAFSSLDAYSMATLRGPCDPFFKDHGWLMQELQRAQIKQAVRRYDADSLWAFGATEEQSALYGQVRQQLAHKGGPTAKFFGSLLERLAHSGGNVRLRVELGGVDLGVYGINEIVPRWTQAAAEQLREELTQSPAGKLLRLVTEADHPLPELVVFLDMQPLSGGRQYVLRGVRWEYRGSLDLDSRRPRPRAMSEEDTIRSERTTYTRARHFDVPEGKLPDFKQLHILEGLP